MDTQIRENPSFDSPTLSLATEKSEVEIEAGPKNGFYKVKVKDYNEDWIEGWVIKEAVSIFKNPVKKRRFKKIEEPTDETLSEDELSLMRRKLSFLYGIHTGFNYSSLGPKQNNFIYPGLGYVAGIDGGFYADKYWQFRFEITLNILNGSTTDDPNKNLSINYLEIGAYPTYLIFPYEIFGGLYFGMGVGLGDLPAATELIGIRNSSEFSGIFGRLGGGYRVALGPYSDIVGRLSYSLSMTQTPYYIHMFLFTLSLEMHG